MSDVKTTKGFYTEPVTGEMGRDEIGFGETQQEAIECLERKLLRQRADAYQHEQEMTHLALIQPFGEHNER